MQQTSGLTFASETSITTVVTVVDTHSIMIAVYQPRFTSTTAKIVKINTIGCSTIGPIGMSSRICEKKVNRGSMT